MHADVQCFSVANSEQHWCSSFVKQPVTIWRTGRTKELTVRKNLKGTKNRERGLGQNRKKYTPRANKRERPAVGDSSRNMIEIYIHLELGTHSNTLEIMINDCCSLEISGLCSPRSHSALSE